MRALNSILCFACILGLALSLYVEVDTAPFCF